MTNIGELFKILGNNSSILNYIDNGFEHKSIKEIVEDALNDEELMEVLKLIVVDVNIIRSKMEIIIGQKIKNKLSIRDKKIDIEEKKKNEEKETTNNVELIVDELEEKEDIDLFSHMIHKPINIDNVIWLWRTCYMEQVDHRMRLINGSTEMYY
jgi:hypothetical protein